MRRAARAARARPQPPPPRLRASTLQPHFCTSACALPPCPEPRSNTRLSASTWARPGRRSEAAAGVQRPALHASHTAAASHRPRPVHAAHHELGARSGALAHAVPGAAEQAVVDVEPPATHRDLTQRHARAQRCAGGRGVQPWTQRLARLFSPGRRAASLRRRTAPSPCPPPHPSRTGRRRSRPGRRRRGRPRRAGGPRLQPPRPPCPQLGRTTRGHGAHNSRRSQTRRARDEKVYLTLHQNTPNLQHFDAPPHHAQQPRSCFAGG